MNAATPEMMIWVKWENFQPLILPLQPPRRTLAWPGPRSLPANKKASHRKLITPI